MPPHNTQSFVIGIDARLYAGNYTGIGTYTRNLVDQLARLDESNTYILYTDRPAEGPGRNFSVVPIPITKRVIWTQAFLPIKASRHHLDLFHATANHEAPFLLRRPVILTVHDLIPLLFPGTVPRRHRLLFRTLIGPAVRKARAIITDSEFVRLSLVGRFGLSPEMIHTIPLACDPVFASDASPGAIERTRKKYGIRGNYVLYVGAMEPRKNIPALISAFQKTTADESLGAWQLVLAGAGGWYQDRTMNAVRSSGLGMRLVMTGFVPPEDLPALYQGASLFVCPSIYEGFGLPVLEAMASRTAVLVSSPSALEEITGSAGVSFDPHSPVDLQQKLLSLMKDEGRREFLAKEGRKRASEYSWERCAGETMSVYRRVIERCPARH